jgi:pimeloyl-ACP methyl ester carboxylesterase
VSTLTATSTDGTTIAYEKSGSGPALVLVDGALCYREFGGSRDLAKALQDSYTVYIYDRRGRGESGDTKPYAAEREVEDLAAVTTATGEVPFVMGQSSGAALALLAAASGVPMKKLASYEAPYVGLKTVKGQKADYLGTLQRYIDEGNRKKAVGYFMVDMVGAPKFLPIVFRLMPKVWKQLQAIAHTLPYDAAVLGDFEVPKATLAKIGVPTLVMGGSKYAPNMKAAVEGAAVAIPGSELVILEGQTHQVSTAALVPELKRFFQ